MFNDSFQDHQIEHGRVMPDQLWEDVSRIVREQNEKSSVSRGMASVDGDPGGRWYPGMCYVPETFG